MLSRPTPSHQRGVFSRVFFACPAYLRDIESHIGKGTNDVQVDGQFRASHGFLDETLDIVRLQFPCSASNDANNKFQCRNTILCQAGGIVEDV